MFALLAVNFEPQIRGIIIVAIAVGVLIGGTYLVVGTNLGARLGFLVVLAGFFGWMAIMGSIWWVYGIGLVGRAPAWQPGEPTTIVRSSDLLDDAEIMLTPMKPSGDAVADAASASIALQSEGWLLLQESDPRRGQAVASADEIIQNQAEEFALGEYLSVAVYDKGGERWPKINESLDFFAFFHEPHYSLVEVAPIVPQRVEPGRAQRDLWLTKLSHADTYICCVILVQNGSHQFLSRSAQRSSSCCFVDCCTFETCACVKTQTQMLVRVP